MTTGINPIHKYKPTEKNQPKIAIKYNTSDSTNHILLLPSLSFPFAIFPPCPTQSSSGFFHQLLFYI